MKAVILVGSGHANSTSFQIGELVKTEFEKNKFQTDLIDLIRLNIKECLGCDYCKTHQNQCVISDEMQGIYPLINQADILIFISPVYFSNIPATLKKIIDRCQLYFNLVEKTEIKPKKFLAIHIGGAPVYSKQFEAFENTYKVLLPDIKAELKDLIGFSDTDRINPLDNKKFINLVKSKINCYFLKEAKR